MIEHVLSRGDSEFTVRALEVRNEGTAMSWFEVPFQVIAIPARPGPANLVERTAVFD
jgi:hypothetical protein